MAPHNRILKKLSFILLTLCYVTLVPQVSRAEVVCPSGYSNPQNPLSAPYTYQICTATNGGGQTVRVYTEDATDGSYKAGDVAQNAATGQSTFSAQPAVAAVAPPTTPQPNSNGTYTVCRPGKDCTTVGDLANALELQKMGYTQSFEQAKAQQAANTNAPTSCDSTWDKWTDPFTCLWRGFLSALGAGLVWLVSWLVTAAGMFFNWTIKVTVLNFTGLFYTPEVNKAVADVWTNLRDLANIFIIGLFVFIAISIILGLQEFGQKKLIARVIIVAILINFSFLFTQIAINTSNFFASQIIAGKAQQLPISGASASVAFNNNAAAASGVAGEFLRFAGAQTFGDTFNALTKVADNNQSAWIALLHGIMAAILLTAAAVTLFYGGMLLLSRSVIFLFLLMTSAFAFATYLSPTLAESDYGFKGWKNQLMRNVMLAPAMMLFLWATLNLAKPLSANGTLGSLIADPKGEAGIGALFSYLVIIGLLFGSLKLSSSLAGASGRLALNATGIAGGLTSMAGAFAGRRLIGRAADIRASNKGDLISKKAAEIAGLQAEGKDFSAQQRQLERLTRQKANATQLSKGTFDLRNTALGAQLKKTGAPAGLTDGTKKNYADSAHKAAEEAAKAAVSAAVGKDKAKEIVEGVHKDDKQYLEASHDNAQFDSKKAREAVRAERDANSAELERQKREIQEAEDAHRDATSRLTGATPAERAALLSEMDTQSERIRNAKAQTATIQSRIAPLEQAASAAEQRTKDTKNDLRKFNDTVKDTIDRITQEQAKMVSDIAARNTGGFLGRAMGIRDNQVAHHAREIAGKRYKIKDKAEARKAITDYNAKHEDHPPAPSGGGGGAAPTH